MHLNDLVIIVVVIGIVLSVGAAQKRFKRLRGLSSGLLVSLVTTCLLAGAAETYFRGYADSGYPFTETLASINWMQRYFSINSDGFRDREWTDAELSSRHVIYCLGDSFAEGWGIDNPEDRYSNVLANMLGDDYAVINIAIGGSTTPQELEILRNYPLQNPDIVIWQYYLNDIDDAALSIGDVWYPTLPVDTPQWIYGESYLANFLYWRLVPVFRPVDASDGLTYWQWNYRAFDNSTIWQIHQQELNDMIAYVEGMGARLIVVIFPNLQDPVGSIAYVDRVAQAVEATGHDEILRLYGDVAALGSQNVIVSRRDAHPNAMFHHVVAQRIYETFFAAP